VDANGGPERCHQLRGRDLYPGRVAPEQDPGSARPSQGSDEFEFRIPARAEELRNVRHALAAWLAGQDAPPDVAADMALAAHEAAANVVEHAYPNGAGDVIVRARREDEGLLVVVQDEGHWRSPSRTDQRGRGLTVMRSLVDEVVIAPSPSGTTVFLRRRLTYAP
jgi:serine/threonine-protein kinase RsbW